MKNIIRGMLIGIANILPGISGGTLAVSMGIYDKLIYCITHILREFRESMRFLVPIILGAAISLATLTFLVETLFAQFPLQTNLLFIGLILGGVPSILQKLKKESLSGSHLLCAVAAFVIVAGMACIGDNAGREVTLDFAPLSMMSLLLVGVLAAATMIIPGVSGSMILLILGYYQPILREIKGVLTALAAFEINELLRGVLILTPFGIGVIVGVWIIAGIIEYVFERKPMHAYSAVAGLIIASPFAILVCSRIPMVTLQSAVTGAIAFIAGAAAAFHLG